MHRVGTMGSPPGVVLRSLDGGRDAPLGPKARLAWSLFVAGLVAAGVVVIALVR